MCPYLYVCVILSLVVGTAASGNDASCLLQGQTGVKTHSQEFQHKGGVEQDRGEVVTSGHVYSFDDLPADCQTFAKACHPPSGVRWSSWADASAAFELCCLGGHHTNTTCKSIANEAFGGFRERSAKFELTAFICTEVKDLYLTHIAWSKSTGRTDESGAVQLLQTPDTRANAIVPRMLELQHEAPTFVNAFLVGATVATGMVLSGASLAQLSMTSLLTAIATQLRKCDDDKDVELITCQKPISSGSHRRCAQCLREKKSYEKCKGPGCYEPTGHHVCCSGGASGTKKETHGYNRIKTKDKKRCDEKNIACYYYKDRAGQSCAPGEGGWCKESCRVVGAWRP